MRWRKGSKSRNVEDRRSVGIPGGAATGIGGLGLILLLLISIFLGVDPSQILQVVPESTGPTGQPSQLSEEQQNQSIEFVSQVLGDTEVTWSKIFKDELGRT